ncbi:DNA cytosine methyltransferase [Pseudomonas vancouverensis]|uniref:DNA (cytosine-5-)-methyltransferase n=1 Tax=Pseudomonas vancouverensis TaxID=95300 RepID=A0A1H2N7G6_PSEVA|nr:DNA cytosine methyltransferase [Pseudomonas vancouverensis]KAB0493992.1 DNA cytosine methyltransferase [Pseudomonas vancouverensis]TDB67596.1 DNA cytosine methyltransferase [Pseudomonas vancouverensis]SDV01439.1 DNA (cytosine-5)-methyltransferase 1 [Pseudomonas vancouverensis]
MNELALFAGSGGGILGGHLLGWRTVCAVERDAYSAQVLAQRQNDRALPTFPIWSDVCSFDGGPWRGLVDVVSGGFPCQDISAAGTGAGIDGARSGLWREMARIIGEVRPELVYLENSPLLVGRGLALVLSDLAEMGYDAQWCIISASDCGAPHQRDRIWLVAHAIGGRLSARGLPIGTQRRITERPQTGSRWSPHSVEGCRSHMADALCEREQGLLSERTDAQVRKESSQRPNRPRGDGFRRWPAEPGMGRVAHGVANRVDRIKALGNGQVPRVAVAAFKLLAN